MRAGPCVDFRNQLDIPNLEWTISANCSNVKLFSTSFETERRYDYVTIGRRRYEGRKSISLIVTNSTVVHFHSDSSTTKSGFVLKWRCESQGVVQGKSKFEIRKFPFFIPTLARCITI